MVASPEAGAAGETCNGQAATIVGAGSISGTASRDVIVGSPGDDDINAGGGNDLICAGDGDDVVADGAGKDIVYLGAGDDVLLAALAKDSGDAVYGDAGSDTASYELRTVPVKVNLATTSTADDGAVGELDKLVDIENAVGGHGNDTLVGTVDGNVLQGRGGNDTITDLSGADVVLGGDGDDTVAQPKTVDPGDYLEGGAGTDEISYAARTADSGEIELRLAGTSADNGSTSSGGEHDSVHGFENARGGQGINDIDGTDGPNVIVMGAQGGQVHALDGDDTITGGAGPDVVDDGLGADLVKLGGGCDVAQQPVFSSNDVLDGGGGACDSIDYSLRTQGVGINIDPQTAGAFDGERGEADLLKGFERAYGGRGDDVIRGNDSANILDAGPDPVSDDGVDNLIGLGGPDILLAHDGVKGNDLIDGGIGNDYGEIDDNDARNSVERLQIY
ncbi:calcium-binding protein [Nocardioides sp. MH1]|uniref:calcium-binding protein n=1 Tax=Nocardioides sp. MH1 TaxID=3242490 RepID=UPI0035213750